MTHWKSTGQDATCSKDGFTCLNSANQKCVDYEIRFYCLCIEPSVNPSATPTARPTASPPYPVSGQTPVMECNHGWTPLMNIDSPGNQNGGDFETITNLRTAYKFCHNSNIVAIRCLESQSNKAWHVVGQNVRCEKSLGLQCFDRNQIGGTCFDFAVQFYCDCLHTTVSPMTALTGSPTAHPTGVSGASPTVSPPPGHNPSFSPHTGASGQPTITPPSSGTGQPTPAPTVYKWTTVPGTAHVTKKACDTPMELNNTHLFGKDQFQASTSLDYRFEPSQARLYSKPANGLGGAWMPRMMDTNQWIQVDFKVSQLVAGIVTQGRPDSDHWVTSYRVSYSLDGLHFVPYIETGSLFPKTVTGNHDRETPQTSMFDREIRARFVRIQPLEWNEKIAVRFEILACSGTTTVQPSVGPSGEPTASPSGGATDQPTAKLSPGVTQSPVIVCGQSMGIGSEMHTKPEQLTSSEAINSLSVASVGKLNNPVGSWVPKVVDTNQWIMVDLLKPYEIDGIITQGSPLTDKWVSKFIVTYSVDGVNFAPYHQFGVTKLFVGNTDRNGIKQNAFDHPVPARYVKIIPIAWSPSGIAMRFDILGCYGVTPTAHPPSAGPTASPSVHTAGGSVVSMQPPGTNGSVPSVHPSTGVFVSPTVTPSAQPTLVPVIVCGQPMGVQNAQLVKPGQMTSSGYDIITSYAPMGRLNNQIGAWSPKHADGKQWILVNFLTPQLLDGINTQGHPFEDKWVTKFSIEYSIDGIQFKPYLESGVKKLFGGNSDKNSIVKNVFGHQITARYIKIIPVEWAPSGIALRFDMLGCISVIPTAKPSPQPTATPSIQPTKDHSGIPSVSPPMVSQGVPSVHPSIHTGVPSIKPTAGTGVSATVGPASQPTVVPVIVCGKPMGIESSVTVKPNQLTSSGYQDVLTAPSLARLNNQIGAWSPKTNNAGQWIMVDFQKPQLIDGILTQGHPLSDKWVTKFSIQYSTDGVHFEPYREAGLTKVFGGNTDKNSIVKNVFSHQVSARYVKIIPVKWAPAGVALRFDMLGCVSEIPTAKPTPQLAVTPSIHPPERICGVPMGLQNPLRVTNAQMTASGSDNSASQAWAGRIFNQGGAWSPKITDASQWIIADLTRPHQMDGILSQGHPLVDKWVTKFSIEYSTDGIQFKPYVESGVTKVFGGNSDKNSIVKNVFGHQITARYVKIIPVEWTPSGIALRFDMLGCYSSTPTVQPSVPPTAKPTMKPTGAGTGVPSMKPTGSGTGVPSVKPTGTGTGVPSMKPTGTGTGVPSAKPTGATGGVPSLKPTGGVTEKPVICGVPMGVENSLLVTDSQITASGFSGAVYAPSMGRIFNHLGAWSPKVMDGNQWIMVDFVTSKLFDGILTQGSPLEDKWVTKFMVSYSTDGKHFTTYEENGKPKMFAGNLDRNGGRKNVFAHEITARYIRIVPVEWATAGIGLRFNILGCYGWQPTARPPTNPTVSPSVSPVISEGPTLAPHTVGSKTPSVIPPTGQTAYPTASPPAQTPGIVCGKPMGVDNALVIKDKQITASGYSNFATVASMGRLFNQFGAWSPQHMDGNQWIMIDFLKPREINGILTQGSPNVEQWVSKFKISYSTDGFHFTPYQEHGQTKLFDGNSDRWNVMKNLFSHPVHARYIKIFPVQWAPTGIAMRVNILGCYSVSPTVIPSAQPTASPTAHPTGRTERTPSEQPTGVSGATPSEQPTGVSGANPSVHPPSQSGAVPSVTPYGSPTGQPTAAPSSGPTFEPKCLSPMGLENYRIVKDNQLTSSSNLDKDHGPENGRLLQGSPLFSGAWVHSPNDTQPWIMVNFLEPKRISGIVTQGGGSENTWITQYTVSYSTDGRNFIPYTDTPGAGNGKIFNGNTDSVTDVTRLFNRNVIAQYIRVVPVKAQGVGAFRFNVLGCNPSPIDKNIPVKSTLSPTLASGATPTLSPPTGTQATPSAAPVFTTPSVCLIPMGVENMYVVHNSQLTASSFKDGNPPSQGRLYNTPTSQLGGAWIPSSLNKQWIQVDLLKPKLISGVITQGSPVGPRWVTQYTVFTSLDGKTFTPYTGLPGQTLPKQFVANADQNSPHRELFNREIVARFVRILPVSWAPAGIALRFNVLGCRPDNPKPIPQPTAVPPSGPTGTPTAVPPSGPTGKPTAVPPSGPTGKPTAVPPSGPTGKPTAVPPSGPTGKPTAVPPMQTTYGGFQGCDVSMGVENPRIVGGRQLTASSMMDIFHSAERARLYTSKDGHYAGAWVPQFPNNRQWIQVDFGALYPVSGVITQGRSDIPQWVMKFEVYYSNDGQHFRPILSETSQLKVFTGNADQNTPKTNIFPAVTARYIRIRPVEWHQAVALRFNVLGCMIPSPTPQLSVPSAIPTGLPTASPSRAPCMYWTPWVSSNRPTAMGEYESLSNMGSYVTVCDARFVTSIECRTVDTKLKPEKDGQIGVVCSLDRKALICDGSKQVGDPCHNYEIRVFCDECEKPTASPSAGAVITPSVTPKGNTFVTPSLTLLTGQTPSVKPPSCVDRWSGWVNKDRPDGNGDFEYLTVQELDLFCPGGVISEVKCASATTGQQYDLTGDNVSCNASYGLRCSNGDNGPTTCQDYKVNYRCQCKSFTSPHISSSASPSTGTYVSPTASPQPHCTVSKWSQWINRDKPGVGSGDHEAYTHEELIKFCPGGEITDIECMTTDGISSNSAGEVMQCNKNIGLKCENSDNAPLPCSDYKIRYFCKCSPLVTPSAVPTTTPTASPPTGQHISPSASPSPGTDVSPTASPPTGQHISPSASPSPGTDVSPTASPQPHCTVSKWSQWINRDKPGVGSGDHEAYTHEELVKFCSGGEITEIECMTTDGISSNSAGEVMQCNKNIGLRCENSDNFPIQCSDYKIRYFCKCSIVTPYLGPSATPTASPPTGQHFSPSASPSPGTDVSPTASPPTGQHISPSPSPSPGTDVSPTASPQPHCTVSKWSQWINRDQPGVGSGDHEAYTHEELIKFCPGGEITDIECMTTDGISSNSAGEVMQCSKNIGLKCENSDNAPLPCSDYKIRYFCKCSPLVTPSAVPTATPTASPPTGQHISPSASPSPGTDVSPTASPPTGQHISPSASPSPGTDVSPTASPQPHCTVSKWSQWINRDKPGDGSGDHEAYTHEELIKFCPGGEITEIECMTTDGISSNSAGEVMQCNKNIGLKCENSDNAPLPCSDYKIRYFCKCSPLVTPSAVPTATPTASPPTGQHISPSASPSPGTDVSPTASPPTGQHISPSASPSPGTDVSPTASPQPHCTVSKWSQWINRDKPGDGSGDHEAYTHEELIKFCPGGEITEIECMTTDGISSNSAGEVMQCNKNIGLKCENSDNAPLPCSDYKIRYFCKCSPIVTPSAVPTATPTASPPTGQHISPSASPSLGRDVSPTASPPTGQHISPSASPSLGTDVSPTASPQPHCTVSKWSQWINRDKPGVGSGDHEAYTHEELIKFCPGGEITDIECMTTDGISSNSAGEVMQCNKNIGLKCENSDNAPLPCSDYKIRYFCKCSPLVTPSAVPTATPTASPPTGQHISPSASPSPGTDVSLTASPQPHCTVSKWSQWINRDKPGVGSGDHEAYTHEELSKFCPGGAITEIECMTTDGISSNSAGEVMQCNKNIGLKCENSDNAPLPCSDYKIRYFCKCSPLVTPYVGPTGSPTVSPMSNTNLMPSASPVCNGTQWSQWINRDKPDVGGGDHESFSPHEFGSFCPGGEILDIECRTVNDISSHSSGEVLSCHKDTGLRCENSDNYPLPCSDYKIRYLCKCSPPGAQPTGSVTWIMPSFDPSGSPTPVLQTCTQSSLSPWVNKDTPDTGDGDHEFLTKEELARFCVGGVVTKIECYAGDIPHESTGEVATCDLQNGLVCNNKDNSPVPCSDYKVRYLCECTDKPTTALPTVRATSGPKITVRCAWSPWLNADQPNKDSTDVGDLETIDVLKTKFGVCSHIVDIECRVAGTTTLSRDAGQSHVSCDINNGLRCYNGEQSTSQCHDYEVRVLCWSPQCSGPKPTSGPLVTPGINPSVTPTKSPHVSPSMEPGKLTNGPHLTTTPPRQGFERTTTAVCAPDSIWDACAFTCEQMCHSAAADVCNGQAPTQCVPGCLPSTHSSKQCGMGERLKGNQQCVKMEMCTCRKQDNTIALPMEYWTNPTDSCSKCHCFNNTVLCTTSTCKPTASPTVGPTVHPTIQPQCHWTNWINVDSPNTGDGDHELLADIRRTNQLCSLPIQIECREVTSRKPAHQFGETVTCDVTNGLTCNTWQNGGHCSDYEVRFYCPCITHVSPSAGPTAQPTASPAISVTARATTSPFCGWSPWMNHNHPDNMTPGKPHEGDVESVAKLISDKTVCGYDMMTHIQCRIVGTTSLAQSSGQVVTCDLVRGLRCDDAKQINGNKCRDYEIRIFCDCSRYTPTPAPTQRPTGKPTASPARCGWTRWMNGHAPNSIGELEILPDLRQVYTFCGTTDITAAECRDVKTHVASSDAGQTDVLCDLKYSGLVCRNDKQTSGHGCADYEIRFLCEPKHLDCSSPTRSPTSPTVSSHSPNVGPVGQPTAHPSKTCSGMWSQWFNKDTPSTGDGDTEIISPFELNTKYNFCGNGKLTKIECFSSELNVTYESTGDNLVCNLQQGLVCKNDDNFPIQCQDYKIRYHCEECTTPTLSPHTTGSPTAVPPSKTVTPVLNYSPGHPIAHPPAGNCTGSWSEWFNRDKPNSGGGDREHVSNSELRTKYHFCVNGKVTNIDCYGLDTQSVASSTGAVLTCNLQQGFICNNVDNFPMDCEDYKIRYYCEECPSPTQAPHITQKPTASPPGHTDVSETPSIHMTTLHSPGKCTGSWSHWINTDKPDTGDGDFEHISAIDLRNKHNFCKGGGKITKIECYSVDLQAYSYSTGAVVTCNLDKGLICKTSDNFPAPCDDYQIRYYCEQCPSPPIPGVNKNPTKAPTATPSMEPPTASTQTPQKISTRSPAMMTTCAAYWSPWINQDKPDTGGGDLEHASVDELRSTYHFCPGGTLTHIECVGADSGISSLSTGEIVKCDLQSGLVCRNIDNDPIPCSDYKIRYYCEMCSPVGPHNIVTDHVKLTTPRNPVIFKTTPTLLHPQHKVCANPMDHPMSITVPDYDLTASTSASPYTGPEQSHIDSTPDGIHSGAWIPKHNDKQQWIEARFEYPQTVTGILTKGREGFPHWVTSYKLLYSSDGYNFHYYEETPGQPKTFAGNFDGSSPANHIITPITARYVRIQPSTWHGAIALRFDLIGCKAPAPTATPTAQPTVKPPIGSSVSPCIKSSWSSWINRVNPDEGEGDHEAMTISELGRFCPSGKVDQVECVTVDGDISYFSSGEVVKCDVATGMTCHNADNMPIPCSNYKIRYHCQCSGQVPSATPTAHPTVKPPIGSSVSLCIKSSWSSWINRVNPDVGEGDHEAMTILELGRFCPSGKVDQVECVTVDGDISYFSSGEVVKCDVTTGLTCHNADNLPIPCSNYKIRYHCQCSEQTKNPPSVGPTRAPTRKPGIGHDGFPTAHPTIDHAAVQFPTSPTPRVPDACTAEMGMKNHEIRDSMLTASSYRDGRHTPQSARLGSAGAWLAAIDNTQQYIEVDFLQPTIISGITTQGRPDAPSFVTSYKLFYSNDGINWNAYREDKHIDKVFAGNFDSVTPVQNMLLSPLRTRFLRISPQTWQGRIAMRFEIHGCVSSYPTAAPTLTFTGQPTAKPSKLPSGETPTLGPTATLVPYLPQGCVVWDDWLDLHPVTLTSSGDHESIKAISRATQTCRHPISIECRTATPDHTPYDKTGQVVSCNMWDGLVCKNSDQSSPKMCYNYEVRVSCIKHTMTCLSKLPTAVPSVAPTLAPYIKNIVPCFTGMDVSACPHDGCPVGQFCDGLKCVQKAECPCLVNNKVVLGGHIAENQNCDTCQCFGGEVKCIPKTCPACPQGQTRQLDRSTCQCQCHKCADGEFQCSTGQCLPAKARCDGITDCTDDEFGCAFTPIFTMPEVPPTKPAVPGSNATLVPTYTKQPELTTAAPTSKTLTTKIPPNPCASVVCQSLATPPIKEGEITKIVKTRDGCCDTYMVLCEPTLCRAPPTCTRPTVAVQRGGHRCCPNYRCVCPPRCPKPTEPTCATGSQVVEILTECNCTTKACVASPVPVCRYMMTKTVINGKDADLTPPKEVIHHAGQKWNDGLCKSCQCVNSSTGTETSCQTQTCAPCKLGEQRVTKPNECCGECKPTGCVDNGHMYKLDEEIPSNRKCYKKKCVRNVFDGTYVVQDSQVTCERLENLPPCQSNVLTYDATGCCRKCIPREIMPTNASSVCQSCSPRLVFGQPQQSIGFFKVHDKGEVCQNVQPVRDLKECAGYCASTSHYAALMGGFTNKCSCCQPAHTGTKTIELVCSASGRKVTKTYTVPETCGCSACSGGK
ncbi:uncharacterized protein LOC121381939 [Gigantopelta aegis]|uniref:uncharacterized protein LOC121381939 n=1 Tax=Gigantopelta aegis TaxID=1735272 RepID=UPI001B88D29C|nr:uncharacterized protein LOC121381939 [Gigantopelta aegis]